MHSKSPKLSTFSTTCSKLALYLLFVSSFTIVSCSDDDAHVVNELGQLKMELDSSKMNSTQSSLAGQINKGADNKDILLQAFVGTHLESYNRQAEEKNNLSVSEIIDQIKKLSGDTSNLFELKKNMESSLSKENGSLAYNREMVSLLNYLVDGRMQCYSGTSLFEVLRQLQTPKSISRDQFVVIFENGHILPGYVESKAEGYHLIGIESTVDGFGRKQYGSVKSLQGVRIVDSDFFIAIEVLESSIINKQSVFNKALEITAHRYGIDLSSLEATLGTTEMMYLYKGEIVLNSEKSNAQNELLAKQLNASIFQFGSSNTPAGERTRSTADEILPAFRGTGISLGEGIHLGDEALPIEIIREEYNTQFLAAFLANGLIWSKPLIGFYANGCLDSNHRYNENKCTIGNDQPEVIISDSSAGKACQEIGARLPTELEYLDLIKGFEHFDCVDDIDSKCLTLEGNELMDKILDTKNKAFWSSTVDFDNPKEAYAFDGSRGRIRSMFRGEKISVLCVKQAPQNSPPVPPLPKVEQDEKVQNDRGPHILRNATGIAIEMRRSAAITYCNNRGAHLPSARELARHVMSLGAKGVVELAAGKPDYTSYHLVKTREQNGNTDSFYFSSYGYTELDSFTSRYYENFWTSSDGDSKIFKGPLHFNSKHGSFEPGYSADVPMAVICLTGI